MLCAERTLTPRRAPRRSPQPAALGAGALQLATRPGRRRSVAAPVPRPPRAARLAFAPTPRGNLKHGAPNGGFRQTERETTRGPSLPFRRGLPRRAPQDGGQCSGSARRPSKCCSAAAGGTGASPGARLGARTRPGGGPGGWRAGSRVGLAGPGLRRFGWPGGAGATRQRRNPARLALGLRLILRTSRTGDPLGSPPLRQAEKLPRLGREPGRAAAWGRARRTSSKLCAGGAGVGRKLQTRALAAAPRPPLQETRRLRGAAVGAHAQRRRRESQPRPDTDSRLRGRGPPQYFRIVTW